MTTPSGAPSPQDEIAGHEHRWLPIGVSAHAKPECVCLDCPEYRDTLDVVESQAARIRELERELADAKLAAQREWGVGYREGAARSAAATTAAREWRRTETPRPQEGTR